MMKMLALLAVLALGACAATGGQERERWSGAAIDNSRGFSTRLLAAQNAERSRLGLARLVWNAKLAVHAKVYANDLARRGAFAHSPPQSRPGEGENLWKGTSGAYSLEEMIGHFIDERADFRPGVFPKVVRRGEWEGVAHYTQIIWPTTREVGCALVARGGTDWLVCRYAPLGNVVGEKVG